MKKYKLSRLFLIILPVIIVFSVNTFAKKDSLLVSTKWLSKNLDKVAILHIGRNDEKYKKGHIPNAIFVKYREIANARDGISNELPKVEELQKVFESIGIGNSKQIVIYGDSKGLAAARVFFTLDYLGHGNRVSLLDGGLEKWKAENREVSTQMVARKSAPFTPKVKFRKVANLISVQDVSWEAKNINNAKVALVDARPNTYFTGEKKSKSNKRGGHIPGSKNVYWKNHFVDKDMPVMLSKKDLQKIYEKQGITKNKTIVVYCQSGGQASHGYFTLRYLGYDVVMYDGSFSEWSNNPNTKVSTPFLAK